MKVLVVEDEMPIRHSIIATLQQNGFEDILDAEDGMQAIHVIKQNKVDLIISDIRMPRMDGIELLKYIRNHYGDIIFIMLSGFDLFEYAQQAINLGAFSYLLKPVSIPDLQSVLTQAMQKLAHKRKLQDHEIQIQIKLKQGTLALRKHFIAEMINGHLPEEAAILKKVEQYDLYFTKTNYCVVLVGIDQYHTITNHMSNQGKDLVKYGVENVCTEILTEHGHIAYPFHMDEGVGILLNSDPSLSTEYRLELSELFIKIQHAVQTYMKFTITVGIGAAASLLSSLPHSYSAAKKAFAKKMIQGDNQVYVFQTDGHEIRGNMMLDLSAEQQLLAYFETNNITLALEFITMQYTVNFSPFSFDLDDVKQMNYQLLILIHKILRKMQLDPELIIGEEFFLYTQVNNLTSLQAIIAWFHGMLETCFTSIHDMSSKSTKKLMEKAREFMASNFHTNLSLDLVADHLHISPEHLSREFKKEIGENFIDYLLKLRIAKAKQYLQQGCYKTYEVANLVGFHDEKYFSKVFKKNTGFTPSEFKFRNT